MTETYLVEVVKEVGIPAAMLIWFMVRTEKVINRNTEAFNRFSDDMSRREK